jgi:hypothetical protein
LPVELQDVHAQLEAIQLAIGNIPIFDPTDILAAIDDLQGRVEHLEQYEPTIIDLENRVTALEADETEKSE